MIDKLVQYTIATGLLPTVFAAGSMISVCCFDSEFLLTNSCESMIAVDSVTEVSHLYGAIHYDLQK